MAAESRTWVTLDPVFENYSLARAARARTARRVTLTLITVLVLLGATGVLGVRSAQVSASSGDYVLNVTYPSVARLGLAIIWKLEVRTPGGFDGPIVVATTRSYFEIFDENGSIRSPRRRAFWARCWCGNSTRPRGMRSSSPSITESSRAIAAAEAPRP